MRVAAALAIGITLSGCDSSDQKNSNSEIVHNQIGRFSIVAAQSGFPALVLDTATGCVMTMSNIDGEILADEVNFTDGTNTCRAGKQLLVVDTLSRINK